MCSQYLRRYFECFALGLIAVMLAQPPQATAETMFISSHDDGGSASERGPARPAPIPSATGGMGAPVRQAAEADLPQTGFTRYSRKAVRVNADREARSATVLALSRQNPDFSIIECVANCVGPIGTIVYFKPRVPTVDKLLPNGGVIQTAAVSAAPVLDVIVCVAGCYDKAPKSPPTLLPVAAANVETAVVVSSADVTPVLSVPSTRTHPSVGGLRRLKSRVRQARPRHQWRIERASVFTSYAKSYRPGYRAY